MPVDLLWGKVNKSVVRYGILVWPRESIDVTDVALTIQEDICRADITHFETDLLKIADGDQTSIN